MQSFLVQLDPGLQNLIVLGLTALVSFLLLQLAALYPPLADYIGQYKAGIVTWLSGLVFNLLQNMLNQVPESWDAVAALVMRLIVEVAAVLLGFALLRRNGVKNLK
jgi:hypothetical protein